MLVNLASLASFRPSGQPAYAMGKAAVRMMTEVLAAELGPSGVRVNAVAPGYVLTPAMQARIESGQRDPRLMVERSAFRRLVQPAEVAEAIFFLCSDAAAAITGVTLPSTAAGSPPAPTPPTPPSRRAARYSHRVIASEKSSESWLTDQRP